MNFSISWKNYCLYLQCVRRSLDSPDLSIFYFSQPIQLINSSVEMVKPGKLPSGKTEIPFEFPLQVKGNKVLYETYHGVFVNIQVRIAFHLTNEYCFWLTCRREERVVNCQEKWGVG